MTPDGSAILRYMTSHDPPRKQDEGPRYFVDTELANDLGIGRSHVRAALRRLEDGGVVETIGSLIGGSEGWGVTPLAGEVALFLADAELV